MQVSQTWSDRHWCERVINPSWPFAYSKNEIQLEETKGRVITNRQDFRHRCQTRGVQSKCHVCQDIACNSSESPICHVQLQGVSTQEMSKNIPTVTDIPWTVGGLHRYDYGGENTTHICLHMVGGKCQSNFGEDYSTCPQRCWGYSKRPRPNDNKPGPILIHEEAKKELQEIWQLDDENHHGLEMIPLMQRFPTQSWNYPKEPTNFTLENPFITGIHNTRQGFSFTLAGDGINGTPGFEDGDAKTARFRFPEGVAVDHEGYVFVADTGNHAIRMISPTGNVITIGGNGKAGFENGDFQSTTQFSSPSGIAIWRDWQWWPYPNPNDIDSFLYKNGGGKLVLFVADTGNHQIRKLNILLDEQSRVERKVLDVKVECFSGCGSVPQPGYADGNSKEARFDSPRGIVVSDEGEIFVADTNNHLIRKIDRFGFTETIAGSTKTAEVNDKGYALEGCPRPCLAGVQGHEDGNALDAKFTFPNDVAIASREKLLFITEKHHVRQLNLKFQSVTTIAGSSSENERDGYGSDASFNKPEGIAISMDGDLFISDSVSCRLRRGQYNAKAVPLSSCEDTLATIFRPPSCSSYNDPVDKYGLKITSKEGNMNYNYQHRDKSSHILGEDFIGRSRKNCVGSPPPRYHLIWNDERSNFNIMNKTLIIDDGIYNAREDPNEGSMMTVNCPTGCPITNLSTDKIMKIQRIGGENITLFTEEIPICMAAVYEGVIARETGGLVDVTIVSVEPLSDEKVFPLSFLSVGQLFSVTKSREEISVETIAGSPSTLTRSFCGFLNSIPAEGSMFQNPTSIDIFANSTLDNVDKFMYVADTNNNVIRGLTATCSFACENEGICIGVDKCKCQEGWGGRDCTLPICEQKCGPRKVCVGPNQCSCIPGYTGDTCEIATCVQNCANGGYCSAPDTCSCDGWFDSNCTTPVCKQTCGNGGNCTSTDTCTCHPQWTGDDCRTPVCEQTCQNGGMCVAPNTCQCTPHFSGYDCSNPVCNQGYFTTDIESVEWIEYRPCDIEAWCNATNSFECRHLNKVIDFGNNGPIERGEYASILEEMGCILLELKPDVLTWFQYLNSTDDSLTTPMRYSHPTPHDVNTNTLHEWSILFNNRNHTKPWTYNIDRQVAIARQIEVKQGRYVCANDGQCVSPDTCMCNNGWVGFDCRVPVCEQGYYEPDQGSFVKSMNDAEQLKIFERFLTRNPSYRLDPKAEGYSNPRRMSVQENFVKDSILTRSAISVGGLEYLGPDGNHQGGYECSIRAVTEWEDYRSGYLHEHPNFYSRYMDSKIEADGNTYTLWIDMEWNYTHWKSHPLEVYERDLNVTDTSTTRLYVYTDEGYKRKGEWFRSVANWTKGRCILEFQRVCDQNTTFKDLEHKGGSAEGTLPVQDTDLSYRPRIVYTDHHVAVEGNWLLEENVCVDQVIRGCFNNGTCVGPNKCLCAEGWSGDDCSAPLCETPCFNDGNCTLPNVCTCEKGWEGPHCETPICAQECNNGGKCVAPDQCECIQWESQWRDGRSGGGVPIFQTHEATPQLTGWTGYDCSTPICVQAERFVHNINMESYNENEVISLGGHGKDGKLECNTVKCPEYDEILLINNGKSFQTGCGYDPSTGCCFQTEDSFECIKCDDEINAVGFCFPSRFSMERYHSIEDIPMLFKTRNGDIKLCGPLHNPGGISQKDYFISDDPFATQFFSNRNYRANITSDTFLCNRHEWIQGNYGKDGRHSRVNYRNFTFNESLQKWSLESSHSGEGIFACHNGGSCIAPDVCTCTDGYDGFDCRTPLCRHQQMDGTIVSCLNGGICQDKDRCICPTAQSILWMKHKTADRGITGWSGTDCSMPVCVQGFYDPDCNDNPSAIGGEGCYRCANGGICTSPDVCQCPDNWTGYDCKTPVCKLQEISEVVRSELMTEDENKIELFMNDPCSMGGNEERGKCILPNQCMCTCKQSYNRPLCRLLGGSYCQKPFHDPLTKYRNVLEPNQIFGTRSCVSGFEGVVDENDKFISCHREIYEPTLLIRHTRSILFSSIVTLLMLVWITSRAKRRRHESFMARIYGNREQTNPDGVSKSNSATFRQKNK